MLQVQSEESSWEITAQRKERAQNQRINEVRMRVYRIIEQRSKKKAVREIAWEVGNLLYEEYEDHPFDVDFIGNERAAREVLIIRGKHLEREYQKLRCWVRWFSPGSAAVREFIKITKRL